MPDTAVFDVDGTLVDTNYQHARSWLGLADDRHAHSWGGLRV